MFSSVSSILCDRYCAQSIDGHNFVLITKEDHEIGVDVLQLRAASTEGNKIKHCLKTLATGSSQCVNCRVKQKMQLIFVSRDVIGSASGLMTTRCYRTERTTEMSKALRVVLFCWQS